MEALTQMTNSPPGTKKASDLRSTNKQKITNWECVVGDSQDKTIGLVALWPRTSQTQPNTVPVKLSHLMCTNHIYSMSIIYTVLFMWRVKPTKWFLKCERAFVRVCLRAVAIMTMFWHSLRVCVCLWTNLLRPHGLSGCRRLKKDTCYKCCRNSGCIGGASILPFHSWQPSKRNSSLMTTWLKPTITKLQMHQPLIAHKFLCPLSF